MRQTTDNRRPTTDDRQDKADRPTRNPTYLPTLSRYLMLVELSWFGPVRSDEMIIEECAHICLAHTFTCLLISQG